VLFFKFATVIYENMQYVQNCGVGSPLAPRLRGSEIVCGSNVPNSP
jgi:hypothetical protein